MLIMEFTKPASRKEIEKSLAPFLTFIASGEEIPLKDIAKKLEIDTKPIGVDEVNVLRSKNVEVGDMNMNASYDPIDDQEGFNHFEIDCMKTPAYPSGHSTQAHLFACLLAKEHSGHYNQFKQLANMISHSRLMARAHYPSDCKFGEKVAQYILGAIND